MSRNVDGEMAVLDATDIAASTDIPTVADMSEVTGMDAFQDVDSICR